MREEGKGRKQRLDRQIRMRIREKRRVANRRQWGKREMSNRKETD